MRRVVALALIIFAAAACAKSEDIVAQDVVSDIPWPEEETAIYRLLQGKETIGTGTLHLEVNSGVIVAEQEFDIPKEEVRDKVRVLADASTLRPTSVAREIDGPEGKRICAAAYEGGAVNVVQKSKDDERTDVLGVPEKSYDTWTDIFLWRTLPFREGYETRYAGVLSCSLGKPDLLSEALTVGGIESVLVPAGTFAAWRLEIRSGGRTQKAWYADDEARTLVRYDNGDLVFELESID